MTSSKVLLTHTIVETDQGDILKASGRENRSVVVFVHGVFGNPASTWGDFQRLLAGLPELEFVDTASYGYPTTILRTMTVERLAHSFEGWCEEVLADYRHIFLLGHSLGGLVVCRLLINCYEAGSEPRRRLLEKIRLVLLFAVPFHGSWLASLVRLFPPITFNKLAEQLGTGSLTTKEIRSTLAAIKMKASKTGMWFPQFRVIVGNEDFVAGGPDDVNDNIGFDVLPVPGTHSQIVRPRSTNDTIVRTVSNAIKPYQTLNTLLSYLRSAIGRVDDLIDRRTYIQPRLALLDPITGRPLNVVLDLDMLKDKLLMEQKKPVLIVGGFGAGKTSLLYMLGHELALNAMQKFPNTLTPIFFSLKYLPETGDLLSAIVDYLGRHDAMFRPAEFQSFLRSESKVILLFDGLDELAREGGYSVAHRVIKQIGELNEWTGVRCVITARSTMFRSSAELGVVGAGMVCRIEPWSRSDVDAYFARNDPDRQSRGLAVVGNSDDVRELCATPIYAMLVCRLLSDQPNSETNQLATAIELYERFILRNIQINFTQFADLSVDKRIELICQIAFLWFERRVHEWSHEEFIDYLSEKFAVMDRRFVTQIAYALTNCSFFERPASRFRFSHQSFQEFFIARALADDLLVAKLDKWEVPLYRDIFEWVFQILERDGFDRVPIETIMVRGGLRPIGNFLAMAYRHQVTAVEPHLRKQLLEHRSDLIRCVCAQGLGLYNPSSANLEAVKAAAGREKNTIGRQVISSIAANWVAMHDRLSSDREIASLASELICLRRDDAERILMTDDPDRIIGTYRFALQQGDAMWTSTVGAILNLGMHGDQESASLIESVATASSHPEIARAYHLICEIWVRARGEVGPRAPDALDSLIQCAPEI